MTLCAGKPKKMLSAKPGNRTRGTEVTTASETAADKLTTAGTETMTAVETRDGTMTEVTEGDCN